MIYLDYAATTPCFYTPNHSDFLNPNAFYAVNQAKDLQHCRNVIKEQLKVKGGKVIFVNSASQAATFFGNNLNYNCESYEHGSVNDYSLWDETFTYAHQYVNQLDGSVFNIEKIAKEKKKEGYRFFLSDFTAAIGKEPIPDNLETFCDAVWFSAHKFYGPVGVGCLWISDELANYLIANDDPVDEYGLYYGTPNLPGIKAMTDALIAANVEEIIANQNAQAATFNEILVNSKVCKFPAPKTFPENIYNYNPNINLVYIKGIEYTGAFAMWLAANGVYVGLPQSACEASSNHRVYKALGYDAKNVGHCLRISYGAGTTEENVKTFIDLIKEYEATYC